MNSSVLEKCDEGGLCIPDSNMGSLGRWLVQVWFFFSYGKFQALLMLWDKERRMRGKGRIVSPDPKEVGRSGKIPDCLG